MFVVCGCAPFLPARPKGPGDWPPEFVNTLGMRFVKLPPGQFMMGSPENELGRDDDEPLHLVHLTRPIWFGTHEVTFEQFSAFVEDTGYITTAEKLPAYPYTEDPVWNSGGFNNRYDPVSRVSWDDAVAFCEWLSKKEHRVYRLPTEAEWEYACRAGTTTAYFTGDTITSEQANLDFSLVNPVYPLSGNSVLKPVGSYPPNPWGIYDMHGNVSEWCYDGYWPYPTDTVTDPTPPPPVQSGVTRGGGCGHPERARSANRDKTLVREPDSPDFWKVRAYWGYAGIRVVLEDN